MDEMREFKLFVEKSDVPDLKALNLLGIQFALCECSKYFFYLQYESGGLYKPATRDFELELASDFSDVQRLAAIWTFWERDEPEDVAVDDGPHPDHAQ